LVTGYRSALASHFSLRIGRGVGGNISTEAVVKAGLTYLGEKRVGVF
jgi:hypothetical protein